MNDLRKKFCDRLYGRVLELGPLHRPMPLRGVPNIRQVDYVDRLTLEEMRQHYPELVSAGEIFLPPTFLDDAGVLVSVPAGTYECLVSSHVLEHMCDPVRAISNWLRVLKSGGYLYLVVPHYLKIFDKKRPLTLIEHMMQDYYYGRDGEKEPSWKIDGCHYLEYSVLVDSKKDRDALEHAHRLYQRQYSIHFHTFTPESAKELLEWIGRDMGGIRCFEGPVMQEGDIEFHFLITRA